MNIYLRTRLALVYMVQRRNNKQSNEMTPTNRTLTNGGWRFTLVSIVKIKMGEEKDGLINNAEYINWVCFVV